MGTEEGAWPLQVAMETSWWGARFPSGNRLSIHSGFSPLFLSLFMPFKDPETPFVCTGE